jgi:hypothetical protein
MHPILVAALAEDRHQRCPCDAVTQQPYRLCRDCRRQCLETQDHAAAPSRRSPLNAHLFRNAPPFAWVLSLLQSTVLVRRLTGLYVRRPTPVGRARGQGEGNPAAPGPRPKATT